MEKCGVIFHTTDVLRKPEITGVENGRERNVLLQKLATYRRLKYNKNLERDQNHFVRKTYAFKIISPEQIRVSVSIQHPNDQFVKRVGRMKALGFLKSKQGKYGTYTSLEAVENSRLPERVKNTIRCALTTHKRR